MEKEGLVSIIVPVYNVEEYLHECIDSVLIQTYKNFELILVDDGSTDCSKEICESYAEKDPRIKVVGQTNGGASSARNTGLRNASGEYIYFLDSDDWLEDIALEKLINLTVSTDSDMVFFDAYAIDETQGIKSKAYYSHTGVYETNNGTAIMKQLLENKEFHVTPWHMFFKSEFITKYKLTFEEGIIYEDMIFSYQVFALAERVSYLPEYLYYRRFRANSVMTSTVRVKNFDSALRVFDEVVSFENTLPPEARCKEHVIRCAHNVFNVYERLSREDRMKKAEEYKAFKQAVLKNKAHVDIALKLRCYGKLLWVIYKVPVKVGQVIKERFCK